MTACPHGQLARQCELCQRDADIAELESTVALLRSQLADCAAVAMEEAAHVCESYCLQIGERYYPTQSKYCAEAIRALIPTAPERVAQTMDDAARWQMLPAFLQKHQINYVMLKRDIDTAIAARGSNDRL